MPGSNHRSQGPAMLVLDTRCQGSATTQQLHRVIGGLVVAVLPATLTRSKAWAWTEYFFYCQCSVVYPIRIWPIRECRPQSCGRDAFKTNRDLQRRFTRGICTTLMRASQLVGPDFNKNLNPDCLGRLTGSHLHNRPC
jgi:hypothetical protein